MSPAPGYSKYGAAAVGLSALGDMGIVIPGVDPAVAAAAK